MNRLLLIAGFLAASAAVAGCARSTTASAGASGTNPDKARKRAEPAPPKAAKAGPDRTPNAPAKQPQRPGLRPASQVAIKVRAVSSLPYPNEADADEDALAVAADAIERKLAELDPPVSYRPTATEVRNEFVRRDTRTVRPPDATERAELEQYKIDPNRVYVEYDVEVSSDQVRELRSRDRVADATRLLGVLTATAVAGFLFLRFDERTGGYLTRWLAIGALALASGAAVGLYFL